jgi:hypothetical protein
MPLLSARTSLEGRRLGHYLHAKAAPINVGGDREGTTCAFEQPPCRPQKVATDNAVLIVSSGLTIQGRGE